MTVIARLSDFVWTILLALVGFILLGVIGAFMGAVLGILGGIAAEVRRGNDARAKHRTQAEISERAVSPEVEAAKLSASHGEQAKELALCKIEDALALGNEPEYKRWSEIYRVLIIKDSL